MRQCIDFAATVPNSDEIETKCLQSLFNNEYFWAWVITISLQKNKQLE